ncbi:MarR family transcriptional regulator [Arsenicicoccus piscis]|uniref:MarR family winged helix-turn-helix transcriptional regulator n=1 Tax=Arsenicicoccus piscis TaxID=673954 RepID=UPI001F4D09C6|nr:MarR family transcriptional regulator [Arsenicicoccus piscis]MCH8627690.1 MarR family transcriptional regulator [Arsenicicoccus piscis]
MTGSTTGSSDEVRWLTATEQQAWRAYLRGQRLLEAALDRDLQEFGVSLPEYEIISMLSEQPGQRLRMSELAGLVVQSRSRLTHTATRLERRGWVARQPVPDDGRGVELLLTAHGLEMLTELAPRHVRSVREHWLDYLDDDLVRSLAQAMARVRDANHPPSGVTSEAAEHRSAQGAP